MRPGDIIEEVAAGGVYPPTVNWFPVSPALMKARSPARSIPVGAQRATKSRQARPALTVSSPRCYLNFGASAIDRILTLIEEAEERRVRPLSSFIDRFSRIYTPVTRVIALLVTLIPPLMFDGGWREIVYKRAGAAAHRLPVHIDLTPALTITSGLAAAARRGALIKGGAAGNWAVSRRLR